MLLLNGPPGKKQFNWYLLATKKSKEDENIQVAVLITLLGHEGRIYETFTWTILSDVPEDATKIKGVLAKFENHFEPSKSQTFARYKFLTHHK